MALASRRAFTDLNDLRLELQLGDFKSEILYWGFFDGAQFWRNYLHVHSFFEVCYVLKGAGDFHINNQVYPVRRGDLFVAKPDERHEIISSTSNPLSIYFWSYTLVPSNKLKSDDLSKLLNAFSTSKVPVLTNQKAISKVLDLLTAEISRKAMGYPVLIKGLVKQLLIETARASTQNQRLHPTFMSNPYQDRVTATIIRYLRDNYSQALSLKEIAAQVYLSERHMSRMFKKATGQTIKQYATGLRMEVAKQLLLSLDISVSEVAYETGYGDVRHFSTVFRKWVGQTPSQYRDQGGTKFL